MAAARTFASRLAVAGPPRAAFDLEDDDLEGEGAPANKPVDLQEEPTVSPGGQRHGTCFALALGKRASDGGQGRGVPIARKPKAVQVGAEQVVDDHGASHKAEVGVEVTGQIGARPTAVRKGAGYGAGRNGVRENAGGLLRRCLEAAGAAAEEAKAWAEQVEAAAWKSSRRSAAAVASAAAGPTKSVCDPKVIDAAGVKTYLGTARRLSSAFKEASVAQPLLQRIRDGTLAPGDIPAIPADDLLPAAKKAKLKDLRTQGVTEQVTGPTTYQFKSETMACQECGKFGSVSWEHKVSMSVSSGKADTWGSSASVDRAERCCARCDLCLAEWLFDL